MFVRYKRTPVPPCSPQRVRPSGLPATFPYQHFPVGVRVLYFWHSDVSVRFIQCVVGWLLFFVGEVVPPEACECPCDGDDCCLWPGGVVGGDVLFVEDVEGCPDGCLGEDDGDEDAGEDGAAGGLFVVVVHLVFVSRLMIWWMRWRLRLYWSAIWESDCPVWRSCVMSVLRSVLVVGPGLSGPQVHPGVLLRVSCLFWGSFPFLLRWRM